MWGLCCLIQELSNPINKVLITTLLCCSHEHNKHNPPWRNHMSSYWENSFRLVTSSCLPFKTLLICHWKKTFEMKDRWTRVFCLMKNMVHNGRASKQRRWVNLLWLMETEMNKAMTYRHTAFWDLVYITCNTWRKTKCHFLIKKIHKL